MPDHERFLERLAERVEQYNIRLYLFVCMTNHFHLVFETPEANCSKFMQSLSTAYTVYYNLRHGRHGHLLDGRYKAKLVEGDDYLLRSLALRSPEPGMRRLDEAQADRGADQGAARLPVEQLPELHRTAQGVRLRRIRSAACGDERETTRVAEALPRVRRERSGRIRRRLQGGAEGIAAQHRQRRVPGVDRRAVSETT